MKASIYLIEKETGLTDSNGVIIFYTVGARLSRASAEQDFEDEIKQGRVRVRKIVATK